MEPGRANVFSCAAHLFKKNRHQALAVNGNSSQSRDSAGSPSITSQDSPNTTRMLSINLHRGSPKYAGIFPKGPPGILGNCNGHVHCKERSSPPCGWMHSFLCRQLGEDFSRPLDKSYGGKTRVSSHAHSGQNPWERGYGARESTSVLKGGGRPHDKRGYYSLRRGQRWIRQPALPGSKVRRLVVAGHQLKGAQPVHPDPALQGGVCEDSQSHYPEGRLAAEVGFKGCVPVGSHTRGSPPGHNHGASVHPRFHHQHEEECVYPNQAHRVPGICSGFNHHDHQSSLTTLRKTANQLLKQEKVTTQQLAQIVGMIVAAHPAILPTPLHYRALERAKQNVLRDQAGYESEVSLDKGMAQDLEWWANSAASFNGRLLQISNWDMDIESNASL